jgi:hypothetical protein
MLRLGAVLPGESGASWTSYPIDSIAGGPDRPVRDDIEVGGTLQRPNCFGS